MKVKEEKLEAMTDLLHKDPNNWSDSERRLYSSVDDLKKKIDKLTDQITIQLDRLRIMENDRSSDYIEPFIVPTLVLLICLVLAVLVYRKASARKRN